MKFRFRLERMLSFVRIKETMKKLEVSALTQKINVLELKKDGLRTNVNLLLNKQKERLQFGTEWLSFLSQKIEQDTRETLRIERMIRKEKEDLEKQTVRIRSHRYAKKRARILKRKTVHGF